MKNRKHTFQRKPRIEYIIFKRTLNQFKGTENHPAAFSIFFNNYRLNIQSKIKEFAYKDKLTSERLKRYYKSQMTRFGIYTKCKEEGFDFLNEGTERPVIDFDKPCCQKFFDTDFLFKHYNPVTGKEIKS